MLFTGCVYHKSNWDHSYRICVMSRLTEINGTTPVRELTEGKLFDYWAKILAPPSKLVGVWYRNEINWDSLRSEYLAHLSQSKISAQVKLIAEISLNQDLTFLCAEWNPKHCHRRLLAEECKRLVPEVRICIT